MSTSEKKVIVVWPPSIYATFIDGETIFHLTLNRKRKHVTPEMIRDIFLLDVYLIIFEVSIIESNFIVTIDKKLRQICDTTKMFDEKCVLLSGNFLRMKPFGTSIFNSLCVAVTADDVNCRRLMPEFEVFHVEEQVRPKCGCTRDAWTNFENFLRIIRKEHHGL